MSVSDILEKVKEYFDIVELTEYVSKEATDDFVCLVKEAANYIEANSPENKRFVDWMREYATWIKKSSFSVAKKDILLALRDVIKNIESGEGGAAGKEKI